MKWHRSLYWRIAAGFVGCLALLLVAQATLFVWALSNSGSTIPNQPPDRFAQTVAVDVSQAIERDATLDIDTYLKQEYARDAQPFLVVFADGRTTQIGGTFPAAIVEDARTRLQQFAARGARSNDQRRAPSDPPRPGLNVPSGEPSDRLFGRGTRGGGFRAFRPALILSAGRPVGLVVVPGRPPFTFLLSRYAPTLVVAAIATLVIGAVLAAAVIFGPARKRLLEVEQAARSFGHGDLTARAPTGGGDEVSAVATAFNAMASDLSARADALAASDRARRQLLADVSHELTTPITAMRGYLETLGMPELHLDDTTRARYVSIVGDETARLERIVGDLLDLAKLEEGGSAFVVDDVNVAHLFARVAERHERALADAGVRLSTSIAAGAEVVRGDGARLEQALQNLAANALRHAPTGSTITLAARPLSSGIALTVADEGPGVAPEHLPHIFDRFYKADSSRTARPGAAGSGLGLSIVKAIAERHNGTVSVESAPGRTVFELTIHTDGRPV